MRKKIIPKFTILIIILLLVILFIFRSYNKNHDMSVTIKEGVIISDINGLYASKNYDLLPSIYDTAYANMILQLKNEKFSDSTYSYFLDYSSNSFVDKDLLSELDTYYYLSLIDSSNLSVEIVSELLDYSNNADGYMCSYLTGLENQELNKLNETYMTLSILSTKNIIISENISQRILKNIKEILKEENLELKEYQLIYGIMDILDNKTIEIEDVVVKKINNVIQEFIDSEEIDNEILENMSYACLITSYFDIPIEETEKIFSICKSIINSQVLIDYNSLYKLMFIASCCKPLDNNIADERIEIIKKSELKSGGVYNVNYIGTARESLMMQVICDVYNIDVDSNIYAIIADQLLEYCESEEENFIIDEVYACTLVLLRNGLSECIPSEDIINEMEKYLEIELTDDNFRSWLYAVKTLEALNYNFCESDLPENYNALIDDILSHGSYAIGEKDFSSVMYYCIMLDGLGTVFYDFRNYENDIYKFLINASQVPTDNDYWFKTRYYALICLDNCNMDYSQELEDTLESSRNLKCGEFYKADLSLEYGDLQTTFQRSLLVKLSKGESIDYVR